MLHNFVAFKLTKNSYINAYGSCNCNFCTIVAFPDLHSRKTNAITNASNIKRVELYITNWDTRIPSSSFAFLKTWINTFLWAAEQTDFTQEHERRWNTPPELTPEPVVKISNDEKFQTRFLSLSPVMATFNLNAGNNNAHSISLGASLDGISLSESNSYNHPTGHGIDGCV